MQHPPLSHSFSKSNPAPLQLEPNGPSLTSPPLLGPGFPQRVTWRTCPLSPVRETQACTPSPCPRGIAGYRAMRVRMTRLRMFTGWTAIMQHGHRGHRR